MNSSDRLILPHRIEYGFTLAELMIVIIVIAILTVIGMAMFFGSTETARNIERKNDITAIYNELERSYRARAAISEPSYPATTPNTDKQIAQLTDNKDIVTAPGVNYNSITPASSYYSPQHPEPVLLALALDPLPDLLLLDEPVSGVDHNGLEIFYDILTALRSQEDMAVILVSHDLSLAARYADQVVLMNRGVLASGTPTEVFRHPAMQATFGLGGELAGGAKGA